MENEFLDKVEDNAAVQTWSKTIQWEKGDSLAKGYVSELWDFTRISVNKHLFRALAQFWNPAYSCFTFGRGDLVPTVEEYMALLRCSKIQADRVYSKATNRNLRDLIPAHPDTKKKMDIFALSVYGLVVFPKALGHVDDAVTDLFDRLNTGVTPVPEIVAVPRRDDILEERWMEILRNLFEEDIEWRAPWMLPDEILYRCGTFDWVPLLGI
ncbi:hypothetical protein Gotur_036109 [Gossypium turneri]